MLTWAVQTKSLVANNATRFFFAYQSPQVLSPQGENTQRTTTSSTRHEGTGTATRETQESNRMSQHVDEQHSDGGGEFGDDGGFDPGLGSDTENSDPNR